MLNILDKDEDFAPRNNARLAEITKIQCRLLGQKLCSIMATTAFMHINILITMRITF